jgi:hypothetical protein
MYLFCGVACGTEAMGEGDVLKLDLNNVSKKVQKAVKN